MTCVLCSTLWHRCLYLYYCIVFIYEELLLGLIADTTQHIVTDRVTWSVCLSVTLVSPAKTAEPIEMPFWLRTRVGPGNHVLDGVPDPPWKGNFEGARGVPL